MTCSILSTFALVAGLALATSAAAMNDDHDILSVKVSYNEAGLHTEGGAKALAQRVFVAASEVCGGESAMIRLTDSFKTCRMAAIARAMTRLNAPLLANALKVSTAPAMASR